MQSIIDYIERRNRETGQPDDFKAWVIEDMCDKMTNEEARWLMDRLALQDQLTDMYIADFLRNKLRQAYQHKAEET